MFRGRLNKIERGIHRWRRSGGVSVKKRTYGDLMDLLIISGLDIGNVSDTIRQEVLSFNEQLKNENFDANPYDRYCKVNEFMELKGVKEDEN